MALGIMFAPTVGAIAAVLFAHGRIQFGRLTKHILLAFLPPQVILVTTWAASTVADVTVPREPADAVGNVPVLRPHRLPVGDR